MMIMKQYPLAILVIVQIFSLQTIQLNAKSAVHLVQSSPPQEVTSEPLLCGAQNDLSPSPSMDFVKVENPGNKPDHTGYGSVHHLFSIGTYDVTAKEYCEFLNAVARSEDPYVLYHQGMSDDPAVACIKREGTQGNYSYQPLPAREEIPITYVSLYSAARFCNWLQNGKPVGKEGDLTTETGAYDLRSLIEGHFTRSKDARYFIPNEDEWYKAAYYNGIKRCYYAFPRRSYWSPKNTHNLKATYNNEANYDHLAADDDTLRLTPVGVFSTTMSPWGAFDMGGNVAEWTELTEKEEESAIRGGSWKSPYDWGSSTNDLEKSTRKSENPQKACNTIGFRVAQKDEIDHAVPFLSAIPDATWLTPDETTGLALSASALLGGKLGIDLLNKRNEFIDQRAERVNSLHSSNEMEGETSRASIILPRDFQSSISTESKSNKKGAITGSGSIKTDRLVGPRQIKNKDFLEIQLSLSMKLAEIRDIDQTFKRNESMKVVYQKDLQQYYNSEIAKTKKTLLYNKVLLYLQYDILIDKAIELGMSVNQLARSESSLLEAIAEYRKFFLFFNPRADVQDLENLYDAYNNYRGNKENCQQLRDKFLSQYSFIFTK